MKNFIKPKEYTAYLKGGNSLSTVVDEKTMKEIHYDLKNPSDGTVCLGKLLKEIERGKHS